MTFLEVFSYALMFKREGEIVSMSKLTIRVVLKGHTFNIDPLSISTIGTLALIHLIMIFKGLV